MLLESATDDGPAEDEGPPDDALESSAYPVMEDAPGGPQQLSRFGAIFTLIDGMVTEASLAYLQSSGGQPPMASRPEACLLPRLLSFVNTVFCGECRPRIWCE